MRPYESQPPLSGSSSPRKYLKEYGFTQKLTAKPWFLWILAMLTMILGISSLVMFFWPPTDRGAQATLAQATTKAFSNIPQLLSPVAIFGFLWGLYQWRTSKQESSMNNYYTRLDRANEWYKRSETVRKEMGFPTSAEADMALYVCTELDNLEFVVEKYRIGYIDVEQACRGLKTFQERCILSNRFLETARQRVHEGDYTTTTTRVVCTVCDAVDEMVQREKQREMAVVHCMLDRSQIMELRERAALESRLLSQE